jgi:protease IV
MALDADYLVDRRRLKKRLGWWRIGAILLGVGLVIVAAGRFAGVDKRNHIARLSITGIVQLDSRQLDALEKIRDNPRVKALIVRLNTPGGTVVGGETLHRALKDVAAKKPVIAVMDDLATSAGYMIAVATDRIFAHRGTVTGSIGVLFQTAEVTELLKKLGVAVETVKSGPFKAEPSPLTKMTPAVRKATQALVDDMQEMFLAMVAEGRRIDRAKVLELADGRIFTGRMAVENGLVDAIGGEREGVDWLEKERKIIPDLPVHDVKLRRQVENWLEYASSLIRKTTFSERLTLDGLVSVWHPRLN